MTNKDIPKEEKKYILNLFLSYFTFCLPILLFFFLLIQFIAQRLRIPQVSITASERVIYIYINREC